MTDKDIEKMLEESGGLDMSHVKKDDILAKAKQEMYFGASVADQKKEKRSSSLFSKKRFIPIIAGAALAFTICIGMIGLYNENFQTIYIDVNPSVALKLNRFDRVIGVEFLNDDAKNLLSDVKLVGADATAAVQTVISACDSAGYVKEDSQIYISASAKEEQKSEKLLKKLKGSTENMRDEQKDSYSVNTYNAKKGEKKEFEKESLSPAKYNIIKEIIEEEDDYRLEDLKGKSMTELHKIKNRHNDDFDDDDDDRDDRDDRDDFDEDDDREHDEDRDENKGENGRPENKPEDRPEGRPEDKPNNKPEDKPNNKLESNGKDNDDDDEDDREDGKKNNKPSHDD